MSTLWVPTGTVHVPGMCVACGDFAVLPLSEEERKANALLASASTRSGNTVATRSMWFPLCTFCAGARARDQVRKSKKYPYQGQWWARSFGIAAAALLAAALLLPHGSGNDPGGMLFLAAIVAAIVAAVTAHTLRARHDRAHPPSEDDVRRLELIAKAVNMTPPLPPIAELPGLDLPAGIDFANESFAQAFRALNPSITDRW
jgi:uncharacterized membrane protein YoaK (UPF0700 family)